MSHNRERIRQAPMSTDEWRKSYTGMERQITVMRNIRQPRVEILFIMVVLISLMGCGTEIANAPVQTTEGFQNQPTDDPGNANISVNSLVNPVSGGIVRLLNSSLTILPGGIGNPILISWRLRVAIPLGLNNH